MRRKISSYLSTVLLSMVSLQLWANSSAEQAALEAIDSYWAARNASDFDVQAGLMSGAGTLSANSDGSFFREAGKPTAEELKQALPGSQATMVFYPEATELSNTVVMVRYYLEGVVEAGSETVSDYRTRVTTVMVMEDDGWKIRSWHFSPLHDGGRHVTSRADFESSED